MMVGEIGPSVPAMETGTTAPTAVLLAPTAVFRMAIPAMSTLRMPLIAMPTSVAPMPLGLMAASLMTESATPTAECLATLSTSVMDRTATVLAQRRARERQSAGHDHNDCAGYVRAGLDHVHARRKHGATSHDATGQSYHTGSPVLGQREDENDVPNHDERNRASRSRALDD